MDHSAESDFGLKVDTWLKAINNNDLVGSILVDFLKAFDLVDNKLPLQTLRHYRDKVN